MIPCGYLESLHARRCEVAKKRKNRCDKCIAQGVPIGMSQYTEGTFFWQCSQCENRWHEHPEGCVVREQAEPYVERGRARADDHA